MNFNFFFYNRHNEIKIRQRFSTSGYSHTFASFHSQKYLYFHFLINDFDSFYKLFLVDFPIHIKIEILDKMANIE